MSNYLTVEKAVAIRMVGVIVGADQVADFMVGKLSQFF
jgi:hypothetical protein